MCRCILAFCVLVGFALPARAADEPAKPNTLTPKEIAEGWILLFDGETTFGWTAKGTAKAQDGVLVLTGAGTEIVSTTEFARFEVYCEYQPTEFQDARLFLNKKEHVLPHFFEDGKTWVRCTIKYDGERVSWDKSGPTNASIGGEPAPRQGLTPVTFRVLDKLGKPGGLRLRNIKLRFLDAKPLFNGKDFTGWKEFPGRKSKFTVTDKKELNVKDGPGDLATEEQWADFVLQLECISNGKHLNSGIFFRCIPGEYQNGYEAQIRNQWEGDDRSKPVDSGTGAIYRRQAARKVVSSDNEWFTMTVIAHGNHFATWVNGYQVTDWTDTRPENKNARMGCNLNKGPISIQGHDPTTDLSFRNIRIGELPKGEKK